MSNQNNQFNGNNAAAGSYAFGNSNKLESFNNIDNFIEQTPKKAYQAFHLGINSSHLVNNDKENSFIKANNDNMHDMNYTDHFSNNYQIPSHYGGYNNHQNMHPHHSHHNQHQVDPYGNYQYHGYGFYYPQQPYYGYDYQNGQQYSSYLDPQGYQNHSYNNYYFNKTPATGPKIQQNIILQKSENKLTGQPTQQGVDEFGNKKDDYSVKALFQQVVISEFQPNCDNDNQQNQAAPTKSNQGQLTSTPLSNNLITLSRGKSSKSKSSMEQESEQQQQQEESNKKSKITPSKRISKKKQRSAKQTPTNQCSSIQETEDIYNYKNCTIQSQFAHLSNTFNKVINSEQSSENMIVEEENNQINLNKNEEKDASKFIRRGSSNHGTMKRAPRMSNASVSMISSATTKITDEASNLNSLNIQQQLSHDQMTNNYYGMYAKQQSIEQTEMQYENMHLNKQYEDQEQEEVEVENEHDDEDDDDENSYDQENQNPNLNVLSKKANKSSRTVKKQNMQVDYDQSSSKSDSEKRNSDAKPCNCRNSKCLKRYCDCFAAGLYCQAECKCEECHNKPEYEEERQKAIQKKKKRIKDAFLPVIQNNTHIKGCHCKNSHCQKKYCVCHQNGVLCSSLCQCVECENKIESMKKDQNNNNINTNTLSPTQYLQQPQYNPQLVSPQSLQQQMVKDSSMLVNANLFANQHLQSPYNHDSLHRDHTEVEFPSTIKKDTVGSKSKPYEEDFSTHKKPSKRKTFKLNDKQKALSFFNETSPADNKYLINKQ